MRVRCSFRFEWDGRPLVARHYHGGLMTEKTSDAGSTPLTRRTYLEQCGLVGGSTLVMSAMRSWDLMAQAGPRPVLSGRPNGTTVVVLGAGVSGLAVAYELGKLGYGVRVLEARD